MARGSRRYADLAEEILARPARLGSVRLVAVDGPAGAGKTRFAERLAAAVGASGARVALVHTDDLLDGWGDLVTFWPRLAEWILDPLRHGAAGAYRRYDWVAGGFEARWRPVPVPDVLILEGVSAGRTEIRPELTMLVWVWAPPELRLDRVLARDGADIRSELLAWMGAEAAHFAVDRPADHADVRVSGASAGPPPEAGSGSIGDISGWTMFDTLRHDPRDTPDRGRGGASHDR
jgi:uridine kinase